MSEDPYFVVKEDVQKSTKSADALFSRWRDLMQQQARGSISNAAAEELKWTAGELTKALKSIQWDIEDLEDTVGAVETNPGRFEISPSELASRKDFIKQSSKFLSEMRQNMTQVETESQKAQRKDLFAVKPSASGSNNNSNSNGSASGVGGGGGGATAGAGPGNGAANGKGNQFNRYAKLEDQIREDNASFIRNEQARQLTIEQKQDANLHQISHVLGNVKNISLTLQSELDKQNEELDGLNSDMDNTENRLQQVMKRVDKVMEASKDKIQTCCIIFLIVAIIVIFALFFAI